jgi:hypothetical protein
MKKQPSKIILRLSEQDEVDLTKFQLKMLEETGKKPSYTDIAAMAGIDLDKLRDFVKNYKVD